MTIMYRVYLTEVNKGCVVFDNLEDAQAFVDEPDYDMVDWYDTESSQFEITEEVE